MAKCEICGKNAKTSYACNECGSKFCERCGNITRSLCEDCDAYEAQIREGYKRAQ